MAKASTPDGRPLVDTNSRTVWRRWLEQNHDSATGVWVTLARKRGAGLAIDYDDAVEEALCFGWIDSKPGKLDDERTLLRFTPRKAGSMWSKSNKIRVAKLNERRLLAPSGEAAIERAKRDGSWSIYDAVEALEVPADLGAALAKNARARRHFEAFPPSSKKIVFWWIVSAKRAETRAMRVAETVRLAEQNARANHR